MFDITQAKEGDILGWRADGIIGGLISFFSRGKYSHVGYYIGDNKTIEAHLKTDGVRLNEIPKDKYKKIDVYRLKVVEVREVLLNQKISYKEFITGLTFTFKTSVGLKYDLVSFPSKFIRGVLGLFSKGNPLLNSDDDRDCAENVGLCFKRNGIDLRPDIHPQSLSPSHICESEKLYKVS
jgi:hypothetical protein